MESSSKYSDFFEAIQSGKICIFETDTVVGIGCKIISNNKNNLNIDKIFKIKNREKSKSLPLLMSSIDMVNKFCNGISDYAIDFTKKYWPGNTTLILNSNKKIKNDLIQKKFNNKETIAIRIPDVDDIIKVIKEIDCPLACTSANFSGEPAVSKITNLSKEFLNKADFVYTKNLNKLYQNRPSQIISCVENKPFFLRK